MTHESSTLESAAHIEPVKGISANTLNISPKAGPTLPEVRVERVDPEESNLTRSGTLAKKKHLADERSMAFAETKAMKPSPEKNRLYKTIQNCKADEDLLEQHLQEGFVPQHGPTQLLSPRVFFVSPLFSVRRENIPRAETIQLDLPISTTKGWLRYEGPELRQSDGLVFLSLLHMLRDIQVGTAVSIQPELVCKALFGSYDGHSREKLRAHIQRLQKGLIISNNFSVQLCLCFDYPKLGPWTVGLDTKIVKLFQISPEIWLSMKHRMTLPSGLATWLYGFIESQTRLIPMSLETLRMLCGSSASEKAYANRMRDALKHLVDAKIIDNGWSIRGGTLRWMKHQGPTDT
jgi:hypothetical protein